jgi:hypothetical protein
LRPSERRSHINFGITSDPESIKPPPVGTNRTCPGSSLTVAGRVPRPWDIDRFRTLPSQPSLVLGGAELKRVAVVTMLVRSTVPTLIESCSVEMSLPMIREDPLLTVVCANRGVLRLLANAAHPLDYAVRVVPRHLDGFGAARFPL